MDGSAISDSAEREFKESPEWKQYDRERLAVADLQADAAKWLPQEGKSAEAALIATDTSSPRTRQLREPQPELLADLQSVGKQRAALALGTTTRTIDRWVKTEKLVPIGGGGRTRFRTRDLLTFLNQKKPRQPRQNETKRDI
jgi:hypothetical protein